MKIINIQGNIKDLLKEVEILSQL